MTRMVSLQIEGGIVKFCAHGLELVPWFASSGVEIKWEDIMCVSPIPYTTKVNGHWKTFRDEPVTPSELAEQIRFYAFRVGLHDRSRVLSSVSLLTRMWLLLSFRLKPLYVDEDKPHPVKGCVEFSFRKRWIQKNGASLLSALEIVEKHSRFDHLGS